MLEKFKSKMVENNCWRVVRSYGSILALDFGEKIAYSSTRTGTNYKGEWALIVNTSNWTLKKNNITLCTVESQKDSIDKNITFIINKKLINIKGSNDETTFTFDDDVVLKIALDSEIEEYDLYTPDDYVLTVGPNHKFLYKKSNE